MTLYTGPVFEMARIQFELTADHLDIPRNERARLLYPKRAVAVSIPVDMDDGRTEVFQGYRVQHHLTLGPTKGGIARDPPSLSRRELEAVSRRYMQEMIPFVSPQTDVMAPDMGTNEQVMAWFMDTYSMHQGHSVNEIVTGKPVALGGTLGRQEATGRGVAYLANRACETIGLKTEGARAIVQGFGNVGSVSAYALARRYGMRITGVSDHTAAYHDPAGLPLDAIERHVAEQGVLAGFSNQVSIDPRELLLQPCEVLVPAAVERVITAENAWHLRYRVLADGANGPTTPDADAVLDQRRNEVFVIPDILCNAGGVIVSYFEWVQDLPRLFWTEAEVNDRLERILEGAFVQVMRRAAEDGISNRAAALATGVEKVRAGKQLRRLFP